MNRLISYSDLTASISETVQGIQTTNIFWQKNSF